MRQEATPEFLYERLWRMPCLHGSDHVRVSRGSLIPLSKKAEGEVLTSNSKAGGINYVRK